jgi:O-antigen/teichoic acid export membrane protein
MSLTANMTGAEMSERAPRPLTGGVVMGAAARAGTAATGAATTIVIARLLGPSGSGAYFVAQSVILVLTIVTTLGIEHGITYFVSAGQWSARAAYSTSLKLSLAMGLLGIAVGLSLRFAFPSIFDGLSLWLTASVIIALPFALAAFYAMFVALATDHYEAYVSPPLLQSTTTLVIALPAAALFDLEGAVVGLAVATISVALATTAWTGRLLPPMSEAANAGQLRRAAWFGIKGYLANALQLLNYRLDLFILAAVASTVDVGTYAVAVAVTSLVWLVPGALSDVLFPRVAHLSARRHETDREMVETKSLRHASLAVAIATVALAIGLEVLVVPIYGEAFRPAIRLGLILLPGAALLAISAVLLSTIVGRGRPSLSLYVVSITTPITILLYVTLIPWLHATGAAVASTCSYAGNFLLACWFYRRVTGRSVFPLLVPTRSEIADLRMLPRAVAARTAALRR